MGKFILALQFLTSIPIKVNNFKENNLAGSLVYFPAVGLLIGIILAGINFLLGLSGLDELAVSACVMVALIILTAGIHLDGLADTADALLSRKNKDKMLEIMRDSRVGAMGVIALISVIVLKISLFYSIAPGSKTAVLLIMCVVSRWAQVFIMYVFPYARQEGKAKSYISGLTKKIFILATIITCFIVFLVFCFKGLLIICLVALAAYLIGRVISSKIDGITGDTVGAVSECVEVIVLFVYCVIGRSACG